MAEGLRISAYKINLGIHNYSISSTGRVYSSFANYPTFGLPFLTLDGKKLLEFDLTNAQPLLLNLFIDHPKFKADCEAGIFYDVMAKEMNISRQAFKLRSFALIFFNFEKIKSHTKLYQALEVVYPGFVGTIKCFKI